MKKVFWKSLLCMVSVVILMLHGSFCSAAIYEYDDMNRVTKVIYEDGSTEVYQYDKNGNLISCKKTSPQKKPSPSPSPAKPSISTVVKTTIRSAKNTKSGIQVTWKKNSKAKTYLLYRSTSQGRGYKKVKTTGSVTFNDTKTKDRIMYYYKVKCIAKSGKDKSGWSSYTDIR